MCILHVIHSYEHSAFKYKKRERVCGGRGGRCKRINIRVLSTCHSPFSLLILCPSNLKSSFMNSLNCCILHLYRAFILFLMWLFCTLFIYLTIKVFVFVSAFKINQKHFKNQSIKLLLHLKNVLSWSPRISISSLCTPLL